MITANDLKVQGIKALNSELKDNDEAIISFRGKPKYIVIDFERYDKLRELELDRDYLEAVKDIENGNYKTISTDEELEKHLENL
jgi:hypothetical protein